MLPILINVLGLCAGWAWACVKDVACGYIEAQARDFPDSGGWGPF